MKVKNNIQIGLLLIPYFFFLSACQGLGDAADDLGNGYVYRSDGGMRWINPGGSIYADGIDGNVLKYKYNHDYIIAIQEPSEEYYKSHFSSIMIYKYSGLLYDSLAIKNADVHQKKFLNSRWWQDSTLRKRMAAHISPDNNNDNAVIESIVDSVIKSDPYYKLIFSGKLNYWIIRKKDNELFGPFSQGEYLRKRHELGIPKELAFDKE
ncbi:hypothetical protein [Arcticibacter tournemirensis]